MCVKLPHGDFNPGPYPPHPTSTYTYGVTIAPRVCGGIYIYIYILEVSGRGLCGPHILVPIAT